MKKTIHLISIVIAYSFLCGCAKNLYFGTSTSAGLDVSGTAKIPKKVSFAINREEVAIVPDDSKGNAHSVFASLDTDWTWFHGFIVKQIFATGDAAIIVSNSTGGEKPEQKSTKDKKTKSDSAEKEKPETSEKPIIFTTGTKLGIDIDFGGTIEAPASLLVGYRRSEMTFMPDVKGKAKLDPVFADISIVKADDKEIDKADASQVGGVRIKQRFATGAAASNAANDTNVQEKLRAAVYGDPVIDAIKGATTRFKKEGAIQKKFNSIKEDKQQKYLDLLNDIFGKATPNALTSASIQGELGKLTDAQVDIALEKIQNY